MIYTSILLYDLNSSDPIFNPTPIICLNLYVFVSPNILPSNVKKKIERFGIFFDDWMDGFWALT
jgi:hypothetical protein